MTVALSVENLTVRLGARAALAGVSFRLEAGEMLGVVGPSGSGKSTLLRTLVGLLGPEAEGLGGRVEVEGSALLDRNRVDAARLRRAEQRAFRAARGESVVLVPQNGQISLDPTTPLGAYVRRLGRPARLESALEDLGLDFSDLASAFPSELSGGMAQRFALALALARRARLWLLDEWTTGLDVDLQVHLLQLLARLQRERSSSTVMVTHELAAARATCDRILVLDDGRIVDELRPPTWVAGPSAHRTTRRLFAGAESSFRRIAPAREAAPILALEGVSLELRGRPVLVDVDLEVRPGETLGIAGPSGAGKTSVARLLAGLQLPTRGRVSGRARIVPQNPYTACHPRFRTEAWVAELLVTERGERSHAAERRGRDMLRSAGLERLIGRRIETLSGGERRWVSLLRARAVPTSALVLDEPGAGLDAVSRSDFVRWLEGWREDNPEAALVIVSHDLRLLAVAATRVLVLHRGQVMESLELREEIFPRAARHPVTRRLLEAARALAQPSNPALEVSA